MLSKEGQKKLFKLLKISDTSIIDDDVEHDAPEVRDITVFSADELKIRDISKFNDGTTTGVEMAIKEYKSQNGLYFKGRTLKALHDHVAAKGDQDETVTKLRDNVTTLTNELTTVKGQLSQTVLQSKIHSFIPELNNGMNKAEAMSVMQANGFEFKEENGVIVPYRSGSKVVDDKLQTALGADVAIKGFFETEKKWVGDSDANNGGKTGGGGGNSQTKPKTLFTKASEVQKAFDDKHGVGASMGTEHDYSGHLQKIMKDAETAGTPLIMD